MIKVALRGSCVARTHITPPPPGLGTFGGVGCDSVSPVVFNSDCY